MNKKRNAAADRRLCELVAMSSDSRGELRCEMRLALPYWIDRTEIAEAGVDRLQAEVADLKDLLGRVAGLGDLDTWPNLKSRLEKALKN